MKLRIPVNEIEKAHSAQAIPRRVNTIPSRDALSLTAEIGGANGDRVALTVVRKYTRELFISSTALSSINVHAHIHAHAPANFSSHTHH